MIDDLATAGPSRSVRSDRDDFEVRTLCWRAVGLRGSDNLPWNGASPPPASADEKELARCWEDRANPRCFEAPSPGELYRASEQSSLLLSIATSDRGTD
jgi:hypothetical protein